MVRHAPIVGDIQESKNVMASLLNVKQKKKEKNTELHDQLHVF